jgi:hypothetical protein
LVGHELNLGCDGDWAEFPDEADVAVPVSLLAPVVPEVRSNTSRALPRRLEALLPTAVADPFTWSVAARLLASGRYRTLPALRRAINKSLAAVLQPDRVLRPAPPAFTDAAGVIEGFLACWREAGNAHDYKVRFVGHGVIRSAFRLPVLWEGHQRACNVCAERGEFWAAMAEVAGRDRPCFFDHVLNFLGGWGFVPPLSRYPEHALSRGNHASVAHAAAAVTKEISGMLAMGAAVVGEPRCCHPILVVVKEGDLEDRARALESLDRPLPCPAAAEHLDEVNAHIDRVREELPEAAAAARLQPVKARPCLDSSRTINPLALPWVFSYCSIHDAVALLEAYGFMAKLDLRRMFNQLPLAERYWRLFGFWWGSTSYVSPRAQFGFTQFPAYANAVMAAVSQILWAHGIPNCFLTDDILVVGRSEADCADRLRRAIGLLEGMGWLLAPDKIEPPAQQMPFLGILIDTRRQRLSIEAAKLLPILRAVRSVLSARRAAARDVWSLVGRLGWVAMVMISGRPYLKFMWELAPDYFDPSRVCSLSNAAFRDLEWWDRRLSALVADRAADAEVVWAPFWTTGRISHVRIFSDASGDVGFGAVCDGRLVHGTWHEPIKDVRSSAWAELVPLLVVLRDLGPQLRGRVVIVTTDNAGNVFCLNKGSCRSQDAFRLLRRIFELAEQYEVYLVGDWVPRELNDLCDRFSKSHDLTHLV